MRPITQSWVDKAEEDWEVAGLTLRSRRSPAPSSACYHAQQSIEKYLKAKLQEEDIPFPKTHALQALLDLVLPVEPLWEAMRPALAQLSYYATAFRYPGDTADIAEAREAVKLCRGIRETIRLSLGLPV